MSHNHGTSPGSLERAIAIAAAVHAGQTDKGGAPYILHPLRVMQRLSHPVAQIAAVLHDVVEDGEGWSFDRLAEEGFSPEVIDAVRAVTKQADEEAPQGASTEEKARLYLQFVQRAARHPIGRLVKAADLEDNLDASRLPQPLSAKDEARLARYRQALDLLRGLA
ncbi:MAG: HD domain-containing protein [Inhella sp.]|uniref:HD domain-containing protein n=1 Tax=Inhella sp. TaxID=1921806 RepID=UPI00391913C7